MKTSGSSRKCRAKTKDGKPCQALASATGLCSLHAKPGRAAELGRKGGRARRPLVPEEPSKPVPPPETAQDIRIMLAQVISDLRVGRLDPKIASTMAYVANVQLRAIEVADLEQRVKILENAEERWGQFKGRSEQELDFFAVNGYWPDRHATITPEQSQ